MVCHLLLCQQTASDLSSLVLPLLANGRYFLILTLSVSFAKLQKATTGFVMYSSTCKEQLSSHWTDFHEIWVFFWKFVKKIQASLWSDKNNRYFTWSPMYLYDSTSHAFFVELEIFQIKAGEKTATHILHPKNLFLIVPFVRQEFGRARQASYNNKAMHSTCWIPKSTDTYSQCIILLAFPQQQCLCEYASMLPYIYTVSLVQT